MCTSTKSIKAKGCTCVQLLRLHAILPSILKLPCFKVSGKKELQIPDIKLVRMNAKMTTLHEDKMNAFCVNDTTADLAGPCRPTTLPYQLHRAKVRTSERFPKQNLPIPNLRESKTVLPPFHWIKVLLQC